MPMPSPTMSSLHIDTTCGQNQEVSFSGGANSVNSFLSMYLSIIPHRNDP